MATKNLEELKDRLYEAFDKALSRFDIYTGGSSEYEKARAAYLLSAGKIAEAITGVEHELVEQGRRKYGLSLPGKG